MSNATTSRSPALRSALLLDAVASGTMGVLLLVAANPLAPVLGLPAGLLRGAGAVLPPFAGFLLWVATRATNNPAVVRAIVAANAAWVVASVALLAVGGVVAPTILGELFVLVQASATALFAYLEYRALHRERTSPKRARTLPET